MLNMSRRGLLASAALGAAFGLTGKVAFIGPAHAEAPLEPTTGFYKYKVGSIEVTAVYDGIWRKPHDPTFIKNASVEDTKAALAKAGLTTEFMPIPARTAASPHCPPRRPRRPHFYCPFPTTSRCRSPRPSTT